MRARMGHLSGHPGQAQRLPHGRARRAPSGTLPTLRGLETQCQAYSPGTGQQRPMYPPQSRQRGEPLRRPKYTEQGRDSAPWPISSQTKAARIVTATSLGRRPLDSPLSRGRHISCSNRLATASIGQLEALPSGAYTGKSALVGTPGHFLRGTCGLPVWGPTSPPPGQHRNQRLSGYLIRRKAHPGTGAVP